jgi:hypothetical protein
LSSCEEATHRHVMYHYVHSCASVGSRGSLAKFSAFNPRGEKIRVLLCTLKFSAPLSPSLSISNFPPLTPGTECRHVPLRTLVCLGGQLLLTRKIFHLYFLGRAKTPSLSCRRSLMYAFCTLHSRRHFKHGILSHPWKRFAFCWSTHCWFVLG